MDGNPISTREILTLVLAAVAFTTGILTVVYTFRWQKNHGLAAMFFAGPILGSASFFGVMLHNFPESIGFSGVGMLIMSSVSWLNTRQLLNDTLDSELVWKRRMGSLIVGAIGVITALLWFLT